MSPWGRVRLAGVELLAEAEQLRHVLGIPPHLAVGGQGPEQAATPAQAGDGGRLERLQHGQLGEDLDELEAPGEPEPRQPYGAGTPDVVPLEAHRAGAWLYEAREHVDQGRLAGAVRADDRDELAGLDAERHAVEGAEVAVEVPDSPGLEDHRGGLSRTPAGHAGPRGPWGRI